MSSKYTIERCRENYKRAVARALNMKFEGIQNNEYPFPVALGNHSSLYREQYHRGFYADKI
jgi:hypothetical protein